MADKMPEITLKPVGFVRNEFVEQPQYGYSWQKVVSDIVVESSLSEALDNLDEFSHIVVIYWMHQSAATRRFSTKVHPRGNQQMPLVGLFASRSPRRPNPVGKTTVRLLERQGNVLKVQGLDAINGTPVIDIKPYIPGYDSVDNAKVPPWINQ